MAPPKYRRRQEPKARRIEQAATALLRDRHTTLPSHRQLDDVAIPAEPAGGGLDIGWIDEERQRRGRQRRLGPDARLGHRSRPELGAVFGRQPVDAADLLQPADAV